MQIHIKSIIFYFGELVKEKKEKLKKKEKLNISDNMEWVVAATFTFSLTKSI